MKKNLFILFSIIIIVSCSCCQQKEKKSDDGAVSVGLQAPDFNADSAFYFVKLQTDFGPRVPNSVAHQKCLKQLFTLLQIYCDTAYLQNFDAVAYDKSVLKSTNIIGSFNPTASRRILLGAHWDSRPFADYDPDPKVRDKAIDGANDGASGVGVLLEVARQLRIKNPSIGVDIIFFDSEDYGTPASENLEGDWWGLGSQYWAKNAFKENYQADYGILLDMVGGSNATFYHEGFSSFYAPEIVSKVWSKAYQLGYGNYFINEAANPITDDHYYVNKLAHIKMINIIHQDKKSSTGFTSTWHTHADNISNIDKQTLKAVGETVLSVIYAEN
jgi:hypothetical protein